MDTPREVSQAANSIGWAIAEFCHVDIHVDAAMAAAQRLYDHGLLKVANPSDTDREAP